MAIHNRYFWVCVILALALCVTQILGSTILILGCLAGFLALVSWFCVQDMTLPIMLFFLPWSQILKTGPGAYSFFTFAQVLVCAVSLVKRRLWFKRYHLAAGVLLLALTLFSKLLDGSFLAMDYIAFMMLIFLFPIVKEEWTAGKYDFFEVVFFLSGGAIMAALCAKQFAVFPNIARYINIHSYLNIVRLSGFYGDPNFYTAQILAALSGCLIAILKETNRRRVTAASILAIILIYCGFLSGSKSFALIAVVIVLAWFAELIRMRGKGGRKILIITCSVLVLVFIATSALFSGLIDVMLTRFAYSKDFSSFTTGRVELWLRYYEEIFSSAKILLLGKGFTNVKVDERAPHNTIIQAVFQFGIIGVIVLIGWCAGFYERVRKGSVPFKKRFLNTCLLIAGVYVPWLALDILFFDEFFLLQWYAFMGFLQLSNGYVTHDRQLTDNSTAPVRSGRRRIRIVWR